MWVPYPFPSFWKGVEPTTLHRVRVLVSWGIFQPHHLYQNHLVGRGFSLTLIRGTIPIANRFRHVHSAGFTD